MRAVRLLAARSPSAGTLSQLLSGLKKVYGREACQVVEVGSAAPSPGRLKRQWLDRVRDEDELAVTVVVADALPRVVPNVLIQKRDELLPVFLAVVRFPLRGRERQR